MTLYYYECVCVFVMRQFRAAQPRDSRVEIVGEIKVLFLIVCSTKSGTTTLFEEMYVASIILFNTITKPVSTAKSNMGLINELDRLSTDHQIASISSVAGPSKNKERQRSSKPNQSKDQRSTSLGINDVQAISTMSEDEEKRFDKDKLADMGISRLQKEVSKYGFRPSKSRKVMVEQLQNVYKAIRDTQRGKDAGNGDTSSLLSSSPPSSLLLLPPETPTISRNVCRNQFTDRQQMNEVVTIQSDSDNSGLLSDGGLNRVPNDHQVAIGDLTMAMMRELEDQSNGDTREGLSSSDKDLINDSEQSDSESSDEDDEVLPNQSLRGVIRTSTANQATALGTVPAEVAQQLHDAIMSDEDLYRRILLFEPISFDEVNSLAKKAGVQGLRSKEILRNWLDVQCICFYSAELTGQRQRY